MRRDRQTKIVATLGPATDSREMIEACIKAGVDVFRFNFSHGSHEDHKKRMQLVRELEYELDRMITVLADLQGPKLRVGTFKDEKIELSRGHKLRFDLDPTPGDETRVCLPHPEIIKVMEEGSTLLLDDGRVRMRVMEAGDDYLIAEVRDGTQLSNRKGVNVPDVVLPLSPLTDKDRKDLAFALELGVDWVALSFVQQPSDVAEARKLMKGHPQALMVKIEKPAAIDNLDELIEMSDGVMLARGDLGVEMPAERVPILQKQVAKAVRKAGKPVIIATQMLESMVSAPTPTRAEASDVATAVYDGADAVMLSAETAAGDYPLEAISIMDRIAYTTERDEFYRTLRENEHPEPQGTSADAITIAARQVAMDIHAAAIVTFTTSGSTTLRAARERPPMPILCLTPSKQTARRLQLSYGVHSVHSADITSFTEMVEKASINALRYRYAEVGDRLVVTAGVPFGTPGTTNNLRIARVR
ncbi:MAG: pyruvate kinase [Alphaproteobacteria bacterium]